MDNVRADSGRAAARAWPRRGHYACGWEDGQDRPAAAVAPDADRRRGRTAAGDGAAIMSRRFIRLAAFDEKSAYATLSRLIARGATARPSSGTSSPVSTQTPCGLSSSTRRRARHATFPMTLPLRSWIAPLRLTKRLPMAQSASSTATST
jgi:hypothetical protein